MAQMAQLAALAAERRVALLCYERRAAECHRSLLIEALMADLETVDLEPAILIS